LTISISHVIIMPCKQSGIREIDEALFLQIIGNAIKIEYEIGGEI